MTLRQRQSRFARLVPFLITKALDLGFEVTIGEVLRSEHEAKRLEKLGIGIYPSLHMYKLAIDLNLFSNGKYLSSTQSHRPLGEWWESQSDDEITCIWGGRFGDGNHYSIAYNGLK